MLTREAGRERARCGIQSARAWSLSARRARETGRGSLTRSAHVRSAVRQLQCLRPPPRRRPPTPARRWKRSSTPRRRTSPPRPPRRRRPTAAPDTRAAADAAAEEEPDGAAAAEPPADAPAVDAEPPADEPAAEAAPGADADEDLPSFVPAAQEEEEDSLAPSAELYDCEKGCGYRGTLTMWSSTSRRASIPT